MRARGHRDGFLPANMLTTCATTVIFIFFFFLTSLLHRTVAVANTLPTHNSDSSSHHHYHQQLLLDRHHHNESSSSSAWWHPRRIPLDALISVEILQPDRLHVVVLVNAVADADSVPEMGPPRRALAKFFGSTTALAREEAVYRALDGLDVTPRFWGHVVTPSTPSTDGSSSIIGFLTEYVAPPPAERGVRGAGVGGRRAEACLGALRAMHGRRIAHGDAHGGNCLVREDGSAVLIDFELALLENGAQEEFERDLWIMAHTADD